MTRSDWIFQNESTVTGNGFPFIISFNQNSGGVLCLEIDGTATSYSVVFEAAGNIGNYHAIYAYDESNKILISTATEATGKLFTFDISAKSAIRTRISAISGGNLTIKGRVVD